MFNRKANYCKSSISPSLISPSFSGEETPSLLSPFFCQPYYSSQTNNRLYKPVTEKLHLSWSGDGIICFLPQLHDLQLLVLKLFHLKRIFGKHLVNIIAFNLLKQWFVIKYTCGLITHIYTCKWFSCLLSHYNHQIILILINSHKVGVETCFSCIPTLRKWRGRRWGLFKSGACLIFWPSRWAAFLGEATY